MPSPLVSVVVPVYNPGAYLDACVNSLLGQSLPRENLELIFVNDGSTDGTEERLDGLAASQAQIRVFHEENSGWAGRPRNVGVHHARGEYVQFVDQDDYLNREALERMYAVGKRNSSDVVLGKIGGTMQGPSSVFARNRERCSVDDAALIDTLTPHKMFRRRFLLDEDIWYPEGRVRLEDQMYMTKAYLRATNVSIVGDYVCYYWMRRDDGKNTSSSGRVTPAYYFSFVRQLLQLMVAETEPGPRRDKVMSRTFRVEMMTRLREPSILQSPVENRQESYAEIKQLAEDFFRPPSKAVATLPATMRLRAHLLFEGHQDSLVALARRQHGDVRPALELLAADVQRGRLRLTARGRLAHRDGTPIVVMKHAKGYWLDPRFTRNLKGVPRRGWDVGNPLDHTTFEFRVYDEKRQTAWFPAATLRSELRRVEANAYEVVLTARTEIHPAATGPGLGAGSYRIRVSYQILGHGTGGDPAGRRGPLRLTVNNAGEAELDRRDVIVMPIGDQFRNAVATLADTGPGRGVRAVARQVRRRLRGWANRKRPAAGRSRR